MVFTMGWKKFAETAKGTVGQVERESHVDSFFDIEGVVHLREKVRRKRPQLWRNNSWFFHHDNGPAHALLLIRDFLANTNITVLHQPPYLPDLAPADFSLFPKLKSTLKGRRFQMIQEITENLQTELCAIPKKGIAGLFPEAATALGVVHQCRRGVP
jgi:transposase